MSYLGRIFKYIWPHVRKHKWAFLGVVLLHSVRVLVDFVIAPIYFKRFIDTVSVGGVNHAALAHQIFYIITIIISLSLFVSITARARGFLYLKFIVDMIRDLRNFAFQKIEGNSQTFFANTFAGSLVTKSRRFVNGFETIFDIFLFNFLQMAILFIGVFLVLFQESKMVCAVIFGLVAIYMLTVAIFIKRKVKFDVLEAEQDSKISGRLADVFGNIGAVKFFSARDREIDSFGKYVNEGAERGLRAGRIGNTIDVVQSFFGFAIGGIVLYILARLWIADKISTGLVVLVETYLTMIIVRMWDLTNALVRFMKATADMKEMVDIFDITPDILDSKNPEKINMNNGHIVFRNVFFKYQMGDEVLTDFNLEIKPGERVGIVGHSGAGKSTLTKLLLRMNDVTSGAITIDGQDIRNVTQDDLRKAISYVPQEPILFHRPIRENINYGKPKATEEEIITVAKRAHAEEFIDSLPQKYDTLVGERGVKLSGGERQRVAIARAMLKDSPILMLDEATSSLDSVSEHYIQDAFNELMKGKTTIVIAHRLSTIQKMDRIIVLDKGQIVEEGTHKELLAKGGVYANLWSHQTGAFLD